MKRALVRLKIKVVEDSVIESIPIFHTSNFIISDRTKFDFIGSLLDAMLNNVPAYNLIIREYRKIASFWSFSYA